MFEGEWRAGEKQGNGRERMSAAAKDVLSEGGASTGPAAAFLADPDARSDDAAKAGLSYRASAPALYVACRA